MIGGIISAASGLVSGIAGGIMAGKNRKKALRALNGEKAFNENLFNSEYYSDPMDRSDNAALLRNLREGLLERGKTSAATAAVMGATPEAMIAEREAANGTIADTMSNIGAMNQRFKDNVMNRYLYQRQNLAGQEQSIYGQNAMSGSTLMNNGALAAAAGALNIIPEDKKNK